MNVQRRIDDIIADKLTIEKEKIVPSADFIKDLGADSLDLVELVMGFEEEFEIVISDEVAETITTVQSAYDFIHEHVA